MAFVVWVIHFLPTNKLFVLFFQVIIGGGLYILMSAITNNEEYKYLLSFTGKNGVKEKCFYSHVDENTGAILRNIISDSLEVFSDLSTNDKVAILLEMIEKELGK